MTAMRAVPVIDFGTVSPRNFRQRYVEASAPVLLRGFLRGWPANAWTPEAFAKRFALASVDPMRSVPVQERLGCGPYRSAGKMTMAEFAASIERAADSELYLVAQSKVLRCPAFAPLWDDMILDPQWLDARCKETGVSLWMGHKGAVTPLHFDLQDALLAQAYGTKRVLLAPPSQTCFLYQGSDGYSAVDPEQPDHLAYPLFKKAELWEGTLEHGDALFLPAHWWHKVRSMTASISLSLANFAWTMRTA